LLRGPLAAGLVLVGLVLIGLAGPVPGPPPAAGATADPVRILVVGDSMTQGSSGDWTWRYRLSKHLTGAGVQVDFVGPRTDLFDNIAGELGDHSYADTGFDQDHAAKWGLSLALLAAEPPTGIGWTIEELVSTYHPDVVLELLGVNDLTFLGGQPAGVADDLRDLVEDARSADPQVDVVLCHVPQPWQPKVPPFNALVDDLARDLDSSDSRVVVAAADEGYVRAEDTWDDAHPNSHGELKIAAAFEDALSALDVGPPAQRPIPDVPRGPRIPPLLSAHAAGAGEVTSSWVRSPGANESEVWLRDATAAGSWQRVAQHVTETSYLLADLPAWHHVQLQTAPIKGNWRAAQDAWSNVVDVEVLDDHLDQPAATVTATSAGVATVQWDRVLGATSYAVQARPADQPGVWLDESTTDALSWSVPDLLNRFAYVFWVRAMRGDLMSDFSAEAPVTVPPLPAVRHVRVIPTRRGVRTTAPPVTAATSYTLRVATAKRCGRPPASSRFAVVGSGLTRTAKRLRVDARAVWVQWVAVRYGIEGELAQSSTACARTRR